LRDDVAVEGGREVVVGPALLSRAGKHPIALDERPLPDPQRWTQRAYDLVRTFCGNTRARERRKGQPRRLGAPQGRWRNAGDLHQWGGVVVGVGGRGYSQPGACRIAARPTVDSVSIGKPVVCGGRTPFERGVGELAGVVAHIVRVRLDRGRRRSEGPGPRTSPDRTAP
jgi:hypothetical protein